jgi:pre-mRNA-processing factor 19
MQVSDESVKVGYSCAALHPDGLILCTGMEDSTVRIWETRTQKVGDAMSHGMSKC